MEVIKLNEKIWQYKNVHSDIDFILSNTLKEHWTPYTNAVNPDGSQCESLIIGSATMFFPEHILYNEILQIFLKCFKNYIDENNLNLSLDNIDINPVKNRDWLEQKYVLVRKYLSGSRMSAHEDGGVDIIPQYTGLLYFNDNFEGGEIGFPNQNLKVKPSKASLIIFPSNIPHEVHLMLSGERYASSAYLYEKPNNA